MRNNVVTNDLSDFGYREIKITSELLDLWVEKGLPEDFYEDEVEVMFNKRSGKVFLTNSEFQVVMEHNDRLEMFYTLPYSGEEGFADELKETYEGDKEYYHPEDIEYMRDVEILGEDE